MFPIIIIAIIYGYNLAIITGTAYAVQFWDWSPAWFILCILLLKNVDRVNHQ